MGKRAILIKRMDSGKSGKRSGKRKKKATVVDVFQEMLDALPTYEATEVDVVVVRGPYAWVKSKGMKGIHRVEFKDLVSPPGRTDGQ
jgi:hypothetical protein